MKVTIKDRKLITILKKELQEWITKHYIYRFSHLGVPEDVKLGTIIKRAIKQANN